MRKSHAKLYMHGARGCAVGGLLAEQVPCVARSIHLPAHAAAASGAAGRAATAGRRTMTSVLLYRSVGYFALWLIIAGASPSDLPVGALSAMAAGWVSLRLLPPVPALSALGLARFIVRFLRQSILAGMDVAWRALDPALPLQPGFIVHRTAFAPGPGRSALCAVMSLQPGTLPVDSTPDGVLRFHCLDVGQPVVAQLAADEATFAGIAGSAAHHG
jgi:multicomponent Na+:H+ antiporter subunit E